MFIYGWYICELVLQKNYRKLSYSLKLQFFFSDILILHILEHQCYQNITTCLTGWTLKLQIILIIKLKF